MTVSLRKGQSISLKKEAPSLKKVMVGLGWDPIKGFFGGSNMDIDASVICIDASGRHLETVYFGNREDRSHSIRHGGDNLTGDGEGDDEQIEITLDRVPNNIQKISVIINIYQAYSKRQHFGKVRNCFVHVDDMDTGKKLCHYDIDGNFDGMTGIFVAELYRHNGEWKFKAVGQGAKVSGIDEMVRMQCSR